MTKRAFARTDTSLVADWWWTIDRPLMAVFALLAALGVIFVFAASPPVAMRMDLSPWHFSLRQCLFLTIGLTLLIGASMLAPLGVARIGRFVFVVGLALLALVPFVGHEVNGATRWLAFGGLRLQPSEFVKPALVLVTAHMIASRNGLEGLPRAALVVTLVIALLLAQPDVGTALLVACVFLTMVFAAGLAWHWVGVLTTGGVGLIVFAYETFGHVRSRIDAFLAADQGYQVQRALDAVTAGGWFGRGPGEGVVKDHLPDSHADFIFAASLEEFGLLTGLVVVLLFAIIVVRSLVLADRQSDRFARIAAVGLATQLGLQATVNLGVNVALLPPKGMTLPFVSYGGSSLLALALGTGLMLALLRRNPRPAILP